jgi:tetratricopeptide (TPR) repeat protein
MLNSLGWLMRLANGDLNSAGQICENALTLARKVLPADHPDIATSMHNLASTYGALGRHEDALRLQEETLACLKRVLPADHPDIATSMNNLARSHFELGRTIEAERLLESALRIRLRVLPPNHKDTQEAMRGLRMVRATRGSAQAPRSSTRVKPNAPCPCGSGRKYKKCCGKG